MNDIFRAISNNMHCMQLSNTVLNTFGSQGGDCSAKVNVAGCQRLTRRIFVEGSLAEAVPCIERWWLNDGTLTTYHSACAPSRATTDDTQPHDRAIIGGVTGTTVHVSASSVGRWLGQVVDTPSASHLQQVPFLDIPVPFISSCHFVSSSTSPA